MKKAGKKEAKKKEKRRIEKKIWKQKIDLKKIKIPLEEKNLEEEIDEIQEEIDDIEFRQFLQPLTPRRTVPVLEKVAVAQNLELEQQLRNVAIQRGNEDEEIKYAETKKADYGIAREHRTDVVKYEAETPKYGIREEKKDENRIIGQRTRSEWKEDKEERWMMEGQKAIEENPSEKKYLEKGQY